MTTSNSISRRNFIGKAAITAGAASLGHETLFGKPAGLTPTPYQHVRGERIQERLPREVCIATVSQQGISADSSEKMAQLILAIIGKTIPYRPDVICLPEVFLSHNYANIRETKTFPEQVETQTELLKQFMTFARNNHCYLIFPMLTSENGKFFNSAILIDRQGNRAGVYRKIQLPDGELQMGLTPGLLYPPVFKTDFGIIGIQICYDINWNDQWKALRQQGAEIIFWPSAFAAGQTLNGRAWQNKVVVVSSTNKDTSKICDISGEVIAKTGRWDLNLICGTVNLEKAFLHTWPFVQRFDEIRSKYGPKVSITNYHEEEWSIIESRSPDVRVKDILDEYEIRTYEQLITDSEIKNMKARG